MEIQQTGYLKPLQIIFGAMLMGQILVSLIFYSFLDQPKFEESDDILTTVLPLIMLSATVLGYVLFNMRRKVWAEEPNLDTKKGLYRSASLTKWAMFEGATLLAVIGYFFMAVDVLLLPLVISLAHFALHFPSRERVSKDLEIDNIDASV